ncbi:PIR Superfamily Protein [Plasmodium ovale wallikeri]|uniref:PIR Superfamily Protein n=2 Tax=Plasmodium ovale TaxID=36330 RepID=A0A1A8Z035_PLAOA|nr:PIR Superfamily Protein [Plasmodium ovale wallikeri]SBT37202.1 PIR Superfamily Protein [Plasmodium ovale wallikeri]SBT73529.1 PIR protein [Plasmodium ovale]
MDDPYDFKHELESTKHYEYLNNYKEDNGSHSQKCNYLVSQFPGYDNIYKFCMSLRNNLEFFGDSSPVTLSKEQHCYYLNCWINDHLINMKFNFEYPKYQEISLYIVSYFNEFPNIQKCKYNESAVKVMEDIQNTKTLYDYGLDFPKIILYSNKYGCTKENETYIKNIREVYNKVRSDCTQTSRKPYCVVWDHIKEFYGDEQISQLACKRIYTDPSEVQLESDQMDIGSGMRESSPEGRSLFGRAEGDASPTALSSTAISIILTLLGLMLILFILYRFTALKSWMHFYLVKKRIIKSIAHEEDESKNEAYENTYEYMNRNFDGIRHIIGFHPS